MGPNRELIDLTEHRGFIACSFNGQQLYFNHGLVLTALLLH